MRFRTTLVLLLLLAGLGAYVYWVEMPAAEQETKKKTVFEFKPDDVTQVTLAYPDREIVLAKSGGQWRLTKPIDALADATTTGNLVNAIAECEAKKELTDASSDPAQYGLDKPFVTVTVQLGDKALPGLRVGKNTPVGFSTYVQRTDDNKVLLTASAFRAGMDKQVKDLRDKTIIAFDDKDVQKLQLRADGKDLTLVQKDGAWRIEQPDAYPADAAAVRNFLSSLRAMRALDFPADQPTDLAAYGLDQPRLALTLTIGKDLTEKRVLVGKENEKKEIYVQTSGQPTVYTVSEWVFRDLNKGASDFRDKTVLAFDQNSVAALDIVRSDGGRVKLTRGADKRWAAEGLDGTLSDTAIAQYLTDLHELKGHDIAADAPSDLAAFGLAAPQLTATLVGADGTALGAVLLGTREANGTTEYTAMRRGGSTVFLVREYLFTRLNKQPSDFLAQPTPAPGSAPAPEDEQAEDEPPGLELPGGDEE
jgi:hypothetical protein